MKKRLCLMLAAVLAVVLACGNVLAEKKVRLPESSFSITIPDGMAYSGPGEPPDTAEFAYVSEKLGLEIEFDCEPLPDTGLTLEAMARGLQSDARVSEVYIHNIAGVDMIVYRTADPDDEAGKGMKCIAYVLLDGKTAQMITFWYASQQAADLTAEIIQSISKE